MKTSNTLFLTRALAVTGLLGACACTSRAPAGAQPAKKAPVATAAKAAAATRWRSVLYPEGWAPGSGRFEGGKLLQDFSYAGYKRGEVPLPKVAGPLFDAVASFGADPSGAKDSTEAIQKALDAASEKGGVVALGAGTFKVSPQGGRAYALRIGGSRVVLRGAGRGKTFLFNDSPEMRGKTILLIQGAGPGWRSKPEGSPEAALARDVLSPTSTIPVASTKGFAPGDWVALRSDATDAFAAEHGMADLWSGKAEALGGVLFHRQVTSVDKAARTLTVDVPVRYYLKVRDGARVHKLGAHIEEAGVEELSVGNREHPGAGGWGEDDYKDASSSAYAVHGASAITFERARDCWASQVASYHPPQNAGASHLLSNGVMLSECRGVTLRGCDFQGSQYGGGGGNGYMYRLTNAQECLLSSCASRRTRHGFVFSSMATSGNVIHGGISESSGVQAAGTGKTNGTGSDHHMHLSQSNLLDNVSVRHDYLVAAYRGAWGSVAHGQSAVHSVFWNTQGLAYIPGREYAVVSEQARWGYVVGTRGPAHAVSLRGQDSAGAQARVAPDDHVEGVGRGDQLSPPSLYLDQLRRRLAKR